MQHTKIYFKDWCPYSRQALELLDEKNVDYEAIDVTDDVVRELEMRERTGRTSVPQIFVGDQHLGGYDDITALDRNGELDLVLSGEKQEAA